ncbi:hypothetical protein [Kribbella ginsengisoli]
MEDDDDPRYKSPTEQERRILDLIAEAAVYAVERTKRQPSR